MNDDYDDDDAPPSRRFRLMHFTMVMLSLLLVSKVSEVVTGARELLSVREAQASSKPAEEEKPAAPEKKEEAKKSEEGGHGEAKEDGGHGDAKEEEGGHGGGEGEKPKEEMAQGEGKISVKQIEELKAKGGAEPYTKSELDLLQNLTARREELEEREKELDLKTKVLDAAERRINDKVGEMKDLQKELAKVIAQYNQHQDSEIKSLVKIYETMKPANAAAIFNEMDMPVLLEVIDKMSDRKVAPILAGMSPTRARDVTQELAEMRRGRANIRAAADEAIKPPAN